jgi:hypothetical protein
MFQNGSNIDGTEDGISMLDDDGLQAGCTFWLHEIQIKKTPHYVAFTKILDVSLSIRRHD